MGRRARSTVRPVATRGRRRGTVGDRHWRGDAWCAVRCALAFYGLAMLLDWGAGTLTPLHAVLWLVLGALVFAVLLPPRVTTGDGWLAVRDLVRERRVRTDALVSVRQYRGIVVCLVVRDAYGHRLEFGTRILVTNPLLWHELESGARRSRERGTLRYGTDVLRRLGDRIDGGTALALLKASGLE